MERGSDVTRCLCLLTASASLVPPAHDSAAVMPSGGGDLFPSFLLYSLGDLLLEEGLYFLSSPFFNLFIISV